MKNSMDRHLVEISLRIHRWRIQADLTLQELANRSGVAASTVHKIEKNQTVPTITVLLRICIALGRRPHELLIEESEDVAINVQRKEERLVIGSGEFSKIEQLASGISNPELDMWRIYHQPGQGSFPGDKQFAFEGEFIMLCEEGELTFSFDDGDHRIGVGDSIHFKTSLPHRWMNTGTTLARAIVVRTIPRGVDMAIREQAQRYERSARSRREKKSCED